MAAGRPLLLTLLRMSSFGRLFRVATFGESHSAAVGCIVEGYPSNCKVDLNFIQQALNRRKPGQSSLASPRKQADSLTVLSGLQNGVSLGSPIAFLVKNQDAQPKDYEPFENVPRPGHADFTYQQKYGIKARSGGGRSSARETAARVCAGALAEQFLTRNFGMKFVSFVARAGEMGLEEQLIQKLQLRRVKQEEVEQPLTCNVDLEGERWYEYQGQCLDQEGRATSRRQTVKSQETRVRCPDAATAVRIVEHVRRLKEEGDSTGGIICSSVYEVPVGLGEPVFDKLHAVMGHAMLSIPAVKGFEVGTGFRGVRLRGSQHNDSYQMTPQGLRCTSNNAGGVLGGVTSGMTLDFRVAFKPVSTISKPQKLVDFAGGQVEVRLGGRHDPCVVPRATPIVTAMSSLVMMDMVLLQGRRSDWT